MKNKNAIRKQMLDIYATTIHLQKYFLTEDTHINKKMLQALMDAEREIAKASGIFYDEFFKGEENEKK